MFSFCRSFYRVLIDFTSPANSAYVVGILLPHCPNHSCGFQITFAVISIKSFGNESIIMSEYDEGAQSPPKSLSRASCGSEYGISPMTNLSMNLGTNLLIRRNLTFHSNDSTPQKDADCGKLHEKYFDRISLLD